MAAPDLSVSRLGQANGGGATDALFLKVFAGEVLTAFYNQTVALSRHMVRTITSGKSASFPATWQGTAHYHTPGQFLVGTSILANERIIAIDQLLVADRSIAQIDEAMNHYDVRSIYSTDIGQALSQTFDRQVLQVGYLASRATATVTGGNGGSKIVSANSKTVSSDLESAIFSAVQKLDEKNVPETDRYVFLKPAQYYMLVQGSAKVFNRDYNPNQNGGYSQGKVFQIAGVEIVKTNNLPTTNIVSGDGITTYDGDFSLSTALVMQKGAAGTVKLLDLSVDGQWLIQNQATLMVGKYAVGHGILRPECAVEIATA
jgi:hypothetical protein